MLTNPCDVFTGQSRSPIIVPFHMLGIVSSCAIVTLSLRCAVFPIFNFKKMSLKSESEVNQGHRKWHHSLDFLLTFYRNFGLKIFEIFDFKNAVTMKTGLGVCQDHWKCHNTIERIRLPIDVL